MGTRHSTLAAITALACAATLTLAGCGGGGSNLAKFCKDGNKLVNNLGALDSVTGLDPASLSKLKDAASAFNKIASEAPTADVKKDAKTLADYLTSAANGIDPSADQAAAQAAGDRFDAYGASHCTGSSLAANSASDTSPTTESTTTLDTIPVTETTQAASITMPDVRNSTVADAKTSLTSAGLTSNPVIVEQQNATVAPGLVVTQDPLPGAFVSDTNTVTLTVSALPAQVYLGDLRATAGYFTTGVASIKGVPYTHGVLQQQGSNYNPAKTTFTLSAHYTRLKGVVGLDDSFAGGGSVQVEVFDQDNKSLFKKTVKVGQPVKLDISVRGVIQLTLESTDLLTTVQNSGTVVWGDAQVISGS
jgi:hypothetical protein